MKHPKKNWIDLSFLRLGPADFDMVRSFVLTVCETLQDPDFFITSDIDTALPNALLDERGRVLGAFKGKNLVGLQALCFDVTEDLLDTLHSDHRFSSQQDFIESSWTMVHTDYRGQRISDLLFDLLTAEVAELPQRQATMIATIHPHNIGSISLYLRLGFVGISLKDHFGLKRILFARCWQSADRNTLQPETTVSMKDVTTIKSLFETGSVLTGLSKVGEKYVLQFSRIEPSDLPP